MAAAWVGGAAAIVVEDALDASLVAVVEMVAILVAFVDRVRLQKKNPFRALALVEEPRPRARTPSFPSSRQVKCCVVLSPVRVKFSSSIAW